MEPGCSGRLHRERAIMEFFAIGHKADIPIDPTDVRFRGKAEMVGHYEMSA
jgi:hypothetical protein